MKKMWRIVGNKIQERNETTEVWSDIGTLPITPTERLDYVNFMNKVYVVTKSNKIIEIEENGTNKFLSKQSSLLRKDFITYDNKLHYSSLRLPKGM